MDSLTLLREYSDGPALLAQAFANIASEHWDALPIVESWSLRQLLCHLADAEIVYADRIKRILTEDNPTLCGWQPDEASRPDICQSRSPDNELAVVSTVRQQVTEILQCQEIEVWQRTAVHDEDGPMTLETVVERITQHIPHHLTFAQAKRRALGI